MARGVRQFVPPLNESDAYFFSAAAGEREGLEAAENEALRVPFVPSLKPPYRWREWAAPDGAKRIELQNGMAGDVFAFNRSGEGDARTPADLIAVIEDQSAEMQAALADLKRLAAP